MKFEAERRRNYYFFRIYMWRGLPAVFVFLQSSSVLESNQLGGFCVIPSDLFYLLGSAKPFSMAFYSSSKIKIITITVLWHALELTAAAGSRQHRGYPALRAQSNFEQCHFCINWTPFCISGFIELLGFACSRTPCCYLANVALVATRADDRKVVKCVSTEV